MKHSCIESALPMSSSGCVTSLSKCVGTCSPAMYSSVCSPAYVDIRHNVSEAKRNGAGNAEGLRKKRRVQKHNELTQSGSEEAFSATPLHQAALEVAKRPVTVVEAAKDTPHPEKEVVDLSGNTRVTTSPGMDTQPLPHLEHHDVHENVGNEDEMVNNQFVPNWGLRNDLRVCTFRACQELISHLATPAEDDFLGHEQLNHDYVDLRNRSDVHLVELDHLRSSLQRVTQDNKGLTNKLNLLDNAHSECSSREKELVDGVKDIERERDEWRTTASDQEKIRVLECEKLGLSAEVAQVKADRQKLVQEFIPTVVKMLHTSVEYMLYCWVVGRT
ncbi:hypothetical protein Tco_0709339 [Tanacetum coccineum]